MKWLLYLVLLIGAGAAWVRLAPVDPAVWHQSPEAKPAGDYMASGWFEAVRDLPDPGAATAGLAALDATIRATPRTRVIAGSLAEGSLTYETRSRVWGFPDYTTITLLGTRISVYGRLRFGAADLGVNRARIEGWLAGTDGISRP